MHGINITRGLLKKNATLQKRSGLEFACQIGVPVLVMLLMVVLQAIVVSQERKFGLRGGEPVVSPAIYYGLQTGLSLEVPAAVLALLNQTRTTNGSAAHAAAALRHRKAAGVSTSGFAAVRPAASGLHAGRRRVSLPPGSRSRCTLPP